MTLEEIVQGTVGGNDWVYKNSSPCCFRLNFSLDPITVYFVPVIKETAYSGDYSDYLLGVVKQYGKTEKISDGNWRVETFLSYPRYSVKGYKSAFFKDGSAGQGTYYLKCWDGSSYRTARYSDFSVLGEGNTEKELVTIIGRSKEYWNWQLGYGHVIGSGDEGIYFDDRREDGVDYYEFLDRFPTFLNEENLENYLKSDDPDPTHFGGVLSYTGYSYTGEDVVEEDISTPGDIIEGLFTDLGVSLSDGTVRAILVDDKNLKRFSNIISGGWISGSLPENVVSIKTIKTPASILTKTETDENIFFNTKNAASIQGRYVVNQFQKFSFGKIKIPESYFSFLDYTNTSIAIFLPYSGLHQLETKTVMNSEITLNCGIDYLTGQIIYYLEVERDGISQVLYQFIGKCDMETPLSALDYGQKIIQMAGALAGVTSSLVMGPGGAALAIGSVGTFGTSLMQNPSSIKIGNSQSNTGWTGIQYPYLIFTRSKVKYPESYGEHFGYPSMKKERLGSLTGYTSVAEIHLDGLTCLEEERQELETLLKNGVIL